MTIYVLGLNYEKGAGGLTYLWSRTQSKAGRFIIPHSDSEWVPYRNIRFEHGGLLSYGATAKGGRLTSKTKSELLKLWFVSEPTEKYSRDVVGSFGELLHDMPLCSEKLKNAITTLDEDTFEFLEIKNVWDEFHNCAIDGGPFFMANLLIRADAWDKEKSQITPLTRADGTSFNSVSISRCAVDATQVPESGIWRDSLTNTVLCTQKYRDFLITSGCRGWSFTEVPVTNRK